MAGSDADPDVPEADRLEQEQEVAPEETGGIDARSLTRDPEVPEADAIEQSQTVPAPDDDDLID